MLFRYDFSFPYQINGRSKVVEIEAITEKNVILRIESVWVIEDEKYLDMRALTKDETDELITWAQFYWDLENERLSQRLSKTDPFSDNDETPSSGGPK